MKKKILLCLALVFMLVCVFAISVSAAEMTNYCSVKLTLLNGDEVTAYCTVSGDRINRDTLYKTTNTDEGTYNWEDVVIFDCRDQIAVGSTPKVFAGIGCNSKAINVKEVYLSDYYTYFLNDTFTSGWKSLETVYISSSVTLIKGFSGSPVKNVIIAENSQLKTIDASAFYGCKSLVNIDISKCDLLTSINTNAFQSCESLTSITFPKNLESIGYNGFYCSGLSGTIVVPNSVTLLDSGSFLSTKIETLVIGDGPVTIGFNFLGTYGNSYLKNVYIPAEATFKQANTFYRHANAVNFYIVGEDPSALVTKLFEQQKDNTYMVFITADQVTESTGAGYGIIHTGYNRCEIFYDDVHTFDTEGALSSCIIECTRCKMMVSSGGEHAYALSEAFAEGRYTSSGVVTNSCTVCGDIESEIQFGAIIVCLGYSMAETGTNGVAIGYDVDNASLVAYETATGKSFDYGVFAASKTVLGQEELFNVEGAIRVDMKKYGMAKFEIKVVGFSDTNNNLDFAMGAYIAVSKDDVFEYTYVQNSAPADGDKYSYDTFSSINESLKK